MKSNNFIRYTAIVVLFTIIGISAAFANPPATPRQFNDITATQLVANIGIGWNLGNGLDVIPETPEATANFRNNFSISQMESYWGHPPATRANITAVKNAGFNAIRIPVSWSNAVDSNFNIRADWMARVTEVVNWAVENDMYIILNTHHDEEIFKFTNREVEASLRAFRRVWEQIAHNFRNYNEKLVFEALNEPRTKGVSHEWSGGNAAERTNLNRHYQVFVDVVRASGGNNDKRILMVNTYGAGGIAAAVNGLDLPNDTVPNKLIVSVHAYDPHPFCAPAYAGGTATTWSVNNSRDTRAILDILRPVYDKFIRNGIPVILGEIASWDKNNTADRAAHAEYYVNYAKSLGMACFWWDAAGMSILNRYSSTFDFPEIVNALMRGAGVNARVLPPMPAVEGTAAVFPLGGWGAGGDNNSRFTQLNQRFQGTLARDGWLLINANPDAATLNLMRTMRSFSFMVLGDGKRYEVMLPTTDTNVAHNHYRFSFTAPAGVATRITVNVPADLRQANWGGVGVVPFNQRNVQHFLFAPSAPGTFDLAVWDVRIIQ
ncbi:MAG: CIA30 family protein [Treponema sp.]|nr:CIA30 family protein [Treponema sp.]